MSTVNAQEPQTGVAEMLFCPAKGKQYQETRENKTKKAPLLCFWGERKQVTYCCSLMLSKKKVSTEEGLPSPVLRRQLQRGVVFPVRDL